MDLDKAKEILAVRIFEWAQREFLHEVGTGCPLLSLISNNENDIGAFILWSNSIPPEQRREMATSLVRSAHPLAIKSKNEPLNQRDMDWQKARIVGISSHLELVPPLLCWDDTRPDFRPINPDQCLDQLVALMPQCLGRVSQKKSLVVCTRKIQDWIIYTEFRFDRKRLILEYTHLIFREDNLPPGYARYADPFQCFRSFAAFFGISQTTEVQVPSQDDSEPMVKALIKYAELFVTAAEPFFEGLGVTDQFESYLEKTVERAGKRG